MYWVFPSGTILVILLIDLVGRIRRKMGDIKYNASHRRYLRYRQKCRKAEKLYGHLMKFTPEERQIFLSKCPFQYTKLCLWAQKELFSIEDYILMVAGEKAHDKGCIHASTYGNIREWCRGIETKPQGVDAACALYGHGDISLEQLIGRIEMILAKKRLNIFDEKEGQLYKSILERRRELDPGIAAFMIEHTN